MMSRHAIRFAQKPIPVRSPYKAIEQPVPMNVAHLFAGMEETDTAEAMQSEPHLGKLLRPSFHGTDRVQPARGKQCR